MTCKNQSEVLRLADECEESARMWLREIDTRQMAAAELRRLHVQGAQDEVLLRQALEALEVSTRFVYADLRPQCEDAIATLRERLGEKA